MRPSTDRSHRRGRFWPTLALASLAANLVLAMWAWRQTPASPVPPGPESSPAARRTPELSAYVALGSFVAENNRIPDLRWSEEQFDAFVDGERASYQGRGVPLDEDGKRLRDEIGQKVQAMLAAEQPDPSREYFRVLREKEGVSRTSTGLHYRITEPGEGLAPKPDDSVVISFSARLPDGNTLPSLGRTRLRTRVRDLLPGLAEGIQLLHAGGKAWIYLPPALAFSDENRPPEIPPQAPVVFFLELHEVHSSSMTR